ncbi:MAG: hypothetical protein ACOX5Q_04310 [Bacillota bacterium]|jgi:hypothetical protein|nr:hypothetical protein [Candidatus Fermentithermobacillaceae bacterium]
MWIVPALVGFAVFLWLGYAWMRTLVRNYRHTLESLAILGLVAVGSLYSGWRTASSVAPEWSFGLKAAIALTVALALFSLFSYMVVVLWKAFLTRRFDEAVSALEDEEESILRQLESMRWQAYRRAQDVSEAVSQPEPPRPDPGDQLKRAVEAWEQGGGAARIRSLKVLEWRDETGDKTPGELRDDIASIEREISEEADESKRDQLKARLAVYKLALIEKEPPGREERARPERKPPAKADEGALRQRLQEIHRELQSAKFAKSQYLRSQVKLGWRSDK